MSSDTNDILTDIDALPTDAQHFALFSGGNDSLVSTHVAYENYDIDYTVYLDTNTGLPENKEYVKDVCREYGWDLLIAQSPYTLREFALGTDSRKPLGFPGPAAHSWAYQLFKERQLGLIATQADERPRYYTGIRSHESERRMRNVKGGEDNEARWDHILPVHDWRDSKMNEYREEHELPQNPVNEKIGRSGDCYCGAFANRDSELVELEAHYPGHADWLKDLENEVQDELGDDKASSYWGFGGLSDKELRGLLAENDDAQMPLCSSCDVPSQ